MLKASILMTLVLVAFASAAHAASFDCRTHQKVDEVAICGDPNLSSLDEVMSRAYGRLRSTLPKEEAARLKEAQVRWLNERRACASDRECLTSKYHERISDLNAQSTQQQPSFGGGGTNEELTKAVQLLRASLECPLPPCDWKCGVSTGYTKQTYSGDWKTLKIIAKTFARRGNSSMTTTARLASVKSAALDKGRNLVELRCDNECFHTVFEDPREGTSEQKKTNHEMFFCDEETAENAKAAVDVILEGAK
ncbi:DUF1311 domain-containing protein [Bradyrhizobium pachyrhizi]|uniref:DUF1311 domain-containing protein n=1 Tax=Bradyrhizobium pachyrhizi TaxID=280333 RepID=A0A844SCS4_9BRAD|nr:lysozyme inhibitor LprI family protein [Bradyrhizobium pachyrhizi]MVT64838.1 DUF1311 domain-containing protein [Bradyrhizobium pachyrhizi]